MREITLKTLVGGAGGVGKTTIIHRYLHGAFIANTSMTIGVQLHTQVFQYPDALVKLVLWDLSGQKRFRFILKTYCEGAAAAYVLFSLHDLGTMDEVPEWISIFKSSMMAQAPILLVGTNLDRAEPDQVSDAKAFAESLVASGQCIGYFETSSKTGHHVDDAINTLLGSTLGIMFGVQ